ncbi:MAG: helix-turn-helix transcriptional regulator [Longimicrobiales bacterium]
MTKNTLSETTSERIKRIIKEHGYTYESLGNEIGISPQAVSEIVNGRTKGATARYSLAKALGHEVEDLWEDARADRTRTA